MTGVWDIAKVMRLGGSQRGREGESERVSEGESERGREEMP